MPQEPTLSHFHAHDTVDRLGPQIQIQPPRNNLLNVNKRAAQLQTFVEKGLDKPLDPLDPGLGHPFVYRSSIMDSFNIERKL